MSQVSVDSVTAEEAGVQHRIGAVSRLAGVPVATLRVWETRYAAFAPNKTAGSHRLYAEADVVRARVLRQLTEAGHSIGGIARLPVEELQRLLARSREAAPTTAPGPVRQVTVLAIGAALAARLDAPGLQQALGAQVRVGGVFTDLDEAEAQAANAAPATDGDPVVVVARLNTVHDANHLQLLRVLAQCRARGAIVLYGYGAPQVLDAMRAAGMVVRRETIAMPDLAQLIRSMVYLGADDGAASPPGVLIPRRRYSDETLARVATSNTQILCECPRHIAELIGQLASFEEYSQSCLNDSEEDARLHAHLRAISGSARAMFERALDLALAHEGAARPYTAAPTTAAAAAKE